MITKLFQDSWKKLYAISNTDASYECLQKRKHLRFPRILLQNESGAVPDGLRRSVRMWDIDFGYSQVAVTETCGFDSPFISTSTVSVYSPLLVTVALFLKKMQ